MLSPEYLLVLETAKQTEPTSVSGKHLRLVTTNAASLPERSLAELGKARTCGGLQGEVRASLVRQHAEILMSGSLERAPGCVSRFSVLNESLNWYLIRQARMFRKGFQGPEHLIPQALLTHSLCH